MKLPLLSFFKKAIPREYFLALLLQDELLQAVVFEEVGGTIHIVGKGQQELPAPIDDASFEELLSVSDKTISAAENSLPDTVQSHKTIFGVKESWTEDLQISKDHLSTLKKLCDELDLQPIGFLVFAEAIAHLLQKEEGAPVSAVLVELGKTHITATLLRAGRVIASKHIATPDLEEQNTSGVLAKAVDTLLGLFTDVEILPSRIVLMDNEKRSQVVKQFTNHTWSKQLPFLHVPQVTPLADGFETQAILFGTATQMGFEVLGLTEETKGTKGTNEPKEESNEEKKMEPEHDKTNESVIPGLNQESSHSELVSESHEKIPDQARDDNKDGENFGFVQDKDVLENAPKNPVVADEFASEAFADIPEEVKEKEEGLRDKNPGIGANAIMITEGMQKILGSMRKIPFGSFTSPVKKMLAQIPPVPGIGSRKIIFLIPLILLLLVGGILWYIFGLHATANLIIDPKVVEKSEGVTFSSTDSTDISSDTIGGKIIPITENGSTSTQATGSQDVGDKAKGTVTIYNNDSDSHTIPAGTTITSPNNLDFITNKDITVASASGDVFSGTKPGTVSVDVTASDIGTDYNIPSGTKFSIGSSSVLAAKNDSAFSGGTKKTVTIVSQKDLDKLTSDLTKNLGDKAKQDVQNNNTGSTILGIFLSTDLTNQKYDHKVGDTVSSVGLSGTITYSALSYTKSDLDKVAVAFMQSNNPNENISSQNVSETIKNPSVSTDGKSLTATLDIKAGLLPKIDTTKVAGELAGKSFSSAYSILSDVPQLASIRSTLSPNLFFLPKTFPRLASHITVTITANE